MQASAHCLRRGGPGFPGGPFWLWLAALALGLAPCAAAQADDAEQFFETRIRPVLVESCFRCHGGGKVSAGLRLDSRAALLQGGDSGPALDWDLPEQSLLVRAVQRADDVSPMPPEVTRALRADQVADFVAWIRAGAVWPETRVIASTAHWAFEPIVEPKLPNVTDASWVRTPVDTLILARLEQAGLRPAPQADKRTLIRRATLDLTGLPPTVAEIDSFLADGAPGAFDSVIERLLASPAYGERWGRHWLDVVRYADTAGETADYPVHEAWRYRDYVIQALNADRPYDEFLREQIAGDILAQREPDDRFAQRVTATGLLAISRRFGFDSENYHHLTIQDSIDTLGQAVLGLSLGCARCHDHKYDPVTMRDYYGLYGIFASSRYAFPGSEQKQRVRALASLEPPSHARPAWARQLRRVAELSEQLRQLDRPVPSAVLRPLEGLDGDFELQAAAAGGSRGVLVPPWLYAGPIAVTTDAQSPFQNRYAKGRVGASIAAGSEPYWLGQALHSYQLQGPDSRVVFSLDFRLDPTDPQPAGSHRVVLGTQHGPAAVVVELGLQGVVVRTGSREELVAQPAAGQWQHLQLELDREGKQVSGRVGPPGGVVEFAPRPFAEDGPSALTWVALGSHDAAASARPGIAYDNLSIGPDAPQPVSLEPPWHSPEKSSPDPASLKSRLQELTGIDGDFELQSADAPPAQPWGPGPGSVVQVSHESQSPYANLYCGGELGIRMPNRESYDGFGQPLPAVPRDSQGRVYAAFDFRCAANEAGGQGTWRYYLGHGPGHSAAVELFLSDRQFFRRSSDHVEPVAPLELGQWYQVRLAIDTAARAYSGTLATAHHQVEFSGELANGWDGVLDYTFIDSYGHQAGVRPALDADNFVLASQPLAPLDAPPAAPVDRAPLRAEVADLRAQLASLEGQADEQAQELNRLLTLGPVPMAYALAEGTPHDEPIQLRGEPDQPGDVVPRGWIALLGGGPLPPETTGSGRLELAEWLTRPENPLTARVMVNRVWQHHFGQGLVATPNDFGLRGQPPTHPELLDYLAARFVAQGWSIKALHRLLMQSAVYQQASYQAGSPGPPTGEADLTKWYARFPRRRLDAEEIRDAILAVCGDLEPAPGAGHPFPSPVSWGFSQHSPYQAVYDHRQRSVYLMTQRIRRHPLLALFDGADPNASTARRQPTTVPTQALFFLNDPFVHQSAEHWAGRLRQAHCHASEQLRFAYTQALGRPPSEDEAAEALAFLAGYAAEVPAENDPETTALAALLRMLLASNEFLHVD